MEPKLFPSDNSQATGDVPADDAAFLRAEVERLKHLMESARARMDITAFQNESLRKELESIKVEALLHRMHRATLKTTPSNQHFWSEKPSAPDADKTENGISAAVAPEETPAERARPDVNVEGVIGNLHATLETLSVLMEKSVNRNACPKPPVELEALAEKLDELKRNASARETRIVLLESERETFDRQLGALERERNDLDTALELTRKDVDTLRSRLDEEQRESASRLEALRVDLENAEERARSACRDREEKELADKLRRDSEKETARLRAEATRLANAMREREEIVFRLQKEISNLRERLVKATRRPALSMPGVPAGTRRTIEETISERLEAFEADPNQETLFSLRALFVEEQRYDEGIRVFRQCFTKPRFQKFLPAICLVVGEFNKLIGNESEAAFYLSNPMIRNDSFAMYLMRTMNLQP